MLRSHQPIYTIQQPPRPYPQYQTIPIPLMKSSSSLPAGLSAGAVAREDQKRLETFTGNSASTLTRKAPYYYTDLYPSKSSSIFDSNLNLTEDQLDDEKADAASIKSTSSSVKRLVQKYNNSGGMTAGHNGCITGSYQLK